MREYRSIRGYLSTDQNIIQRHFAGMGKTSQHMSGKGAQRDMQQACSYCSLLAHLYI